MIAEIQRKQVDNSTPLVRTAGVLGRGNIPDRNAHPNCKQANAPRRTHENYGDGQKNRKSLFLPDRSLPCLNLATSGPLLEPFAVTAIDGQLH